MEEEIPTVNVRQLISAYERGIPNEFKRPRAHSLGNVLGNDVIVRSHNYHTLSDIEDALELVEENLNRYRIYNKRKHVEFQETLFTLLTSVINIEPGINDEPVRKKNLITKTQKLVSVLNQKLPNSGSSVSTPTAKEPEVQLVPGENKTFNSAKPSTPSEIQKQIVENEYNASVSVQHLKQNFQSKIVESVVTLKSTSKQQDASSKQLTSTNNVQIQEIPGRENPPNLLLSADNVDSPEIQQEEEQEEQKPEEPVSVRKLRNMFEQKEKENKTGLELIIKPKSFQYQVFIPYTAETLGTYRFFRANSGHYMNEVGVLNRVNMSKAKSTVELNSYSYKTFEEKQKERRNEEEEVEEKKGEDREPEEEVEEDDKKSVEDTYADSDVSDVSHCDSLDSVKEYRVENLEIKEGGEKITLLRSVSVKETASMFENSSAEEEVHINTSEVSEVLKQYFVQDDPEDIGNKEQEETLLSVNADSGVNNTEETLILTNGQNEDKLEDDEDVFISQNDWLNNYEEVGITEEEPPLEITSINEIAIDSVEIKQAEDQFENLLQTNESVA